MNQPNMPVQDPLVNNRDWVKYPKPTQTDPNEGLMSDPWIKWNQFNTDTVQSTPKIGIIASATNQSASVGTTPFQPGSFSSGLYRATYYFRVTRAAGTSSALSVSFLWTDGAVSCSVASVSVTGNTTSTTDSKTFMMLVDANTPISWSTTYASVGAPTMTYSISLTLENLNT